MKSKNKKEYEIIKDDVLKELPEFVNLIILLIGSGTNLEDSLYKIFISYGDIENNKRGFFKKETFKLIEEKHKSNENLISLFNSFAKRSNIKELNRISNILLENRLKGSLLWDKLKSEGEELWKERSRRANEKLKLLDSKLVFPLSLTLLALLIVSIAPALLEIS